MNSTFENKLISMIYDRDRKVLELESELSKLKDGRYMTLFKQCKLLGDLNKGLNKQLLLKDREIGENERHISYLERTNLEFGSMNRKMEKERNEAKRENFFLKEVLKGYGE